MHNSKRKYTTLPPRWLNCPNTGNLINDIFVPFKTPLGEKFISEIPVEQIFSLDTFLNMPESQNIGLIIDLTNSKNFYTPNDLEERLIDYKKICCLGYQSTPSNEQVNEFIETVDDFLNQYPDRHIGVHCTHGFNRTGFMIVSYLVNRLDFELETAVEIFALSRPTGIYKQDYLDELIQRYDHDVKIIAKERPLWCLADDNETDDDNRTHRKTTYKNQKPKEPKFMDGVDGVEALTDNDDIAYIQKKVKQLMNIDKSKIDFVGSQPVSLTMENLHLLRENQYNVSWKADGTRYMMLICEKDCVYMLDRDNSVYRVNRIHFPIDESNHMEDTLIDGEMVIDIYKGVKYPRYLIYDIMNLNGNYVGDRQFTDRLKLINNEIIKNREHFVTPKMKSNEKFGVRIKHFWPTDKCNEIWEGKFRSQVCHEMDGLIFQPSGKDDVYMPGTCTTILKWKPVEMNSVDFLVKWVYEQKKDSIPEFVGYLYVGGQNNYFDTIKGIRKKDREQYNEKIVECVICQSTGNWKIMRERTDKSKPNYITTANNVVKSIQNPVTIDHVYRIFKINR